MNSNRKWRFAALACRGSTVVIRIIEICSPAPIHKRRAIRIRPVHLCNHRNEDEQPQVRSLLKIPGVAAITVGGVVLLRTDKKKKMYIVDDNMKQIQVTVLRREIVKKELSPEILRGDTSFFIGPLDGNSAAHNSGNRNYCDCSESGNEKRVSGLDSRSIQPLE
jgi:hypothetical protein